MAVLAVFVGGLGRFGAGHRIARHLVHRRAHLGHGGRGLIIVFALLATLVLAWLLTRSITAPLGQALSVARTIAAGDLSQPIVVRGKDEPAQLLTALATMQEQLQTTIRGISESAQQLASAAEEMSSVMEQSTRGLQAQNDEIEQAATAVTQMSAAVDEVASTGGGHFNRWQSRVSGRPEYGGELPVSALAEEMFTEGEGEGWWPA